MNQTFRNKSKQPYNKPTLKIHGTVQEMTLGASSIPVGSDGQCPPGTAVTGNGDCSPSAP